jgi:sugar phosphate isomerase/epimerase
MTDLTRRSFLATVAAASAARGGGAWNPDRLGIACGFGTTEASVHAPLAAARQAGFTRAQIQIPWAKVGDEYVKSVPAWLASEGVRAEVVGAYVNCAVPGNVLMDCRAQDFSRAIDLASSLGARGLAAWTGGYGRGLMTTDLRNFAPAAGDAICRFLDPFLKRLEQAHMALALESYITLVCPDAPSLARLLKRLPKCVGAVLDPPNLTPVARYGQRDEVLRAMLKQLRHRTAVVHLKDFRLAKNGTSYDLPGPLGGEMNYRLFIDGILGLPGHPPIIAEHLKPADFAAARRSLLPLFGASR